MKVRLKEDPKEWRKATLLTVVALAVLSSLLCWRRLLPQPAWATALAGLATVGLSATVQPGWFRGYYRVSTRLGFWLSQWLAHALLALMFLVLIVPLGFLLRLAGKDSLRLKRPQHLATYWTPAKESGPLDRLF